MSHRIPTTKKPRRGALYSREEIEVISKYKEEYKDQTTRALRAHVMRNKILVDIFNYWDLQGTLPSDEVVCGERVKVNDNQLKSSTFNKNNRWLRKSQPGFETTGARVSMLTNPMRT